MNKLPQVTTTPPAGGTNINNQSEWTEGETNQEYEEFVKKFKPKLTTDDCYTPPPLSTIPS